MEGSFVFYYMIARVLPVNSLADPQTLVIIGEVILINILS